MGSKMMENPLPKVACCLGATQGLAYGILSLIAIILYNTATPDPDLQTYMDIVNAYMYGFFVGDDVESFADQTFTPGTFTGFAWIHFLLNILWVAVSIQTFLGKGFSLQKSLRSWSIVTAAVCVWDLLTVIIIGADYDKCITFFKPLAPLSGACANGLLPVLVIVAKGFVLWVVNVVFAVLLFMRSRQPRTGNQPTFQTPSTLQQEYGTNPGLGQYPANAGQGQYPVGGGQAQYPAYQSPAPVYSRTNPEYIVPVPEPDYDQPSNYQTKRTY